MSAGAIDIEPRDRGAAMVGIAGSHGALFEIGCHPRHVVKSTSFSPTFKEAFEAGQGDPRIEPVKSDKIPRNYPEAEVDRKAEELLGLKGPSDRPEKMWIGVCSNGKIGMQNRWAKKYSKEKYGSMEKMAQVYMPAARDFDGRQKMEKHLIEHFREKFGDDIVGNEKDETPLPKPFVVYTVWHDSDLDNSQPETNFTTRSKEKGDILDRMVSFEEAVGLKNLDHWVSNSWLRNNHEPIRADFNRDKSSVDDVAHEIRRAISDTDKFWVGITSGGEDGMRKRWNGKYKREIKPVLNRMQWVYEPETIQQMFDMEGSLIKRFQGDAEFANQRNEELPDPQVVYIAWKDRKASAMGRLSGLLAAGAPPPLGAISCRVPSPTRRSRAAVHRRSAASWSLFL